MRLVERDGKISDKKRSDIIKSASSIEKMDVYAQPEQLSYPCAC